MGGGLAHTAKQRGRCLGVAAEGQGGRGKHRRASSTAQDGQRTGDDPRTPDGRGVGGTAGGKFDVISRD